MDSRTNLYQRYTDGADVALSLNRVPDVGSARLRREPGPGRDRAAAAVAPQLKLRPDTYYVWGGGRAAELKPRRLAAGATIDRHAHSTHPLRLFKGGMESTGHDAPALLRSWALSDQPGLIAAGCNHTCAHDHSRATSAAPL